MIYILAFGGAILILVVNKRLGKVFHWVGWFLLFAGLSQLMAFFIVPLFGSNLSFYHSVMIINFGLICAILYHLLATRYFRKILLLIFGAAGIIFVYLLFPVFNTQFASRALTVLNISVIAGCMLFFYEILLIPEKLAITRQGKFWIATAFLVYHISSFFIWLISELPEYLGFYSVINRGLVLLFYTLLILAVVIQLNNRRHVKY